ncbi:methyl-accepting chemotaxis protein [Lyngbya aestuarii]|uniref:methyl-accepting chemotaxis protein n=1 Tax=Lyngbya aestuarii TaxID=118322 RepID=UPI00403DCA73
MTQTSPKDTEKTAANSSYLNSKKVSGGSQISGTNDSATSSALPYSQEVSTAETPVNRLPGLSEEKSQPNQLPSLSRRLLLTILPATLIPLVIASAAYYGFVQQRAKQQMRQNLTEQAQLASEVAGRIVEDVVKIPLGIASNPLIIDAVRDASRKAENDGLDELSIEQLENRFAKTRILELKPTLNNYLLTTIKNEGLAEIHISERNGLMIAYSEINTDFVQRDDEWWPSTTGKNLWISDPIIDNSTNTFGIELVQSILDADSGEFLGAIKMVVPSQKFEQLAEILENSSVPNSQQIQLIDASSSTAVKTITPQGAVDTREIIGGETIAQVIKELVKVGQEQNLNPEQVLSSLKTKYSLQKLEITTRNYARGNSSWRVSFAYQGKQYSLVNLPNIDWVAVASINTGAINATGGELALIFSLTALGVGAAAALVAVFSARQLSQPINELSNLAERVSAGDLDIAVEPRGTQETQKLAQTFNHLIAQLKGFVQEQQFENQRTRLLKEITLHLFQSLEQEEIFDRAVADIRESLKTDRVVVYSFNENWQGTVIAESVGYGWPRALGAKIDDPCFAQGYVERYKKGRVQPTPDIYQAGLTECYLKQLEPFGVRANLVAPIVLGDQLLGLLIAHQCSGPRSWQPPEIDLFAQLAAQVGLALDRGNIERQRIAAQQQKLVVEKLEKRILELLEEVEPISQGNLTIRAKVTPDEIGTIADAYNATVGNLQKIVTQVQAAASQVAQTTSSNQVSVQALSAEALRSVQQIAQALERTQEMARSVKEVATKAEQAEAAVEQAAQTVTEGDAVMSRTVEGILTIRETVAGTRQKVKRLGESSQKISTVVNLISNFAEQSNLLALNASIEAARAGEEGRGFAVVAEQVRSLARQSTAATKEIEKLVAAIQTETGEVMVAMEAGTEQVVKGTQLVDETRQSLNKITVASTQINQLVAEISQATVIQSAASEAVTLTMTDVVEIASHTSNKAKQVSSSLEQLQTVAQVLQENVSQFKVK